MAFFDYLTGTMLNAFGIGPKATRATLDASGLTAARTFLFPDGSGTFAMDAAVVHNTGTENIAGLKTFTQGMVTAAFYTGVAANPARFMANKARGTIGSPTATLNGDLIGGFYAGGYNGASFNLSAGFQAQAVQDFTGSNGGTKLQLVSTRINESIRNPRWEVGDVGHFVPFNDNTYDLGNGSQRVREIFCANGTINTSDADHKTEVRALTENEILASIALSRELGAFKWLESVQEKGYEAARWHIGMTVQRAIQIMEQFGLDPFGYSFICYDEWDAVNEVRDEESGMVLVAKREAGHVYGFRPDELMKFIARGFAARLDALEARAAA